MHKALLLFSMFCLAWFQTQASSLFPDKWPLHSTDREYRAVWFCTLGGMDWPGNLYAQTEYKAEIQRAALRAAFDRLKAAGINTILFQARIRSTTAYPSQYEPWDGAFSGTPGVAPPYDVLQFAIEEAHLRGMELHAYLVVYPICSVAQARQLGRQALPVRRPDLCVKCGDRWMMDPGVPETAEYIAGLCREILERYEVDGIHLDYIRYPEKEIPFNDARTYARYGKGTSKEQWRRDNVTRTVRLVHETIRSIRPWVRLTCSPLGKYADLPRQTSRGWNARNTVSQDAQLWLREGWMDALFPMMYFDNEHFYPFAMNWLQESHGRPVVPGLGIYFLSPSQKDWDVVRILRQMNFLRSHGLSGHAFFRSRFLLENHKGILDITRDFHARPALTPAMTWADSVPPSAPDFNVSIEGRTLRFRWAAVADATPVSYNIYRSSPEGAELVAARLRGTTHDYTPALPRHLHDNYVVVAMDAYGNESKISSSHEKKAVSSLSRWVEYPSAFGQPTRRKRR